MAMCIPSASCLAAAACPSSWVSQLGAIGLDSGRREKGGEQPLLNAIRSHRWPLPSVCALDNWRDRVQTLLGEPSVMIPAGLRDATQLT